MANRFGTDILIQAPDPRKAALFYVKHLGFEITDHNPKMIGLHGKHINLFIEPGPPLGPVLEVTVENVADAKQQLVNNGCEVVNGFSSMLYQRSVWADLQPHNLALVRRQGLSDKCPERSWRPLAVCILFDPIPTRARYVGNLPWRTGMLRPAIACATAPLPHFGL